MSVRRNELAIFVIHHNMGWHLKPLSLVDVVSCDPFTLVNPIDHLDCLLGIAPFVQLFLIAFAMLILLEMCIDQARVLGGLCVENNRCDFFLPCLTSKQVHQLGHWCDQNLCVDLLVVGLIHRIS